MSDDELGLFEFIPHPESPEQADDPENHGPARNLIGDAPLTLEGEGTPQAEPLPGPGTTVPFPAAPSATRRDHLPRYAPFVLETANGTVLFCEDRVRPIEENIRHSGFLLFLVDFSTSSSVGVLRLQGAFKYADLLARKKLEEQGEMSAADRLILYDVRRGRGREFSVLYQVVSRELVRAAEMRCRRHPGGMQYADTLGLLRGVLSRKVRHGGSKLRACALKLPGALLLLAAEGPRFVLARRYPFMESSARSLSGCLAAVRRDVDAVNSSESTCSVRLVETGVPSGEHELLVSCAAGIQGIEVPPPCVLQYTDGTELFSALPGVVQQFPLACAHGPGAERILRPLERCEKYAWALLCAGILFCWVLVWFVQQQGRELEQQAVQLRREIRRAVALPRHIPRLPPGGFADRAALAGMLNRVWNCPSPAAVWNRIGAAKPEALSISSLELQYTGTGVQAVLEGRLYAGLQDSQQLALDFIRQLRAGGAVIREHQLHLDGTGEQFISLMLEYHNHGKEHDAPRTP